MLEFCRVFFVVLWASVKFVAAIEGPVCSFEDPVYKENLTIDIFPYNPIFEFDGGFLQFLNVKGLSTYRYNVTINCTTLQETFEVNLGSFLLHDTKYAVRGYLDAKPFQFETIPSGNFSGFGDALINITNFRMSGTATYFLNIVTNQISIVTLEIGAFDFDFLWVDLGPNFLISGKRVDWEGFSLRIKENFDAEFAEKKSAVTERFREAANNMLNMYKISEWFEYWHMTEQLCRQLAPAIVQM